MGQGKENFLLPNILKSYSMKTSKIVIEGFRIIQHFVINQISLLKILNGSLSIEYLMITKKRWYSNQLHRITATNKHGLKGQHW
jgi:hypothetical protein